MSECWGCIDLYDPADPPALQVEGWFAVPGCPAHDRPLGSDSAPDGLAAIDTWNAQQKATA